MTLLSPPALDPRPTPEGKERWGPFSTAAWGLAIALVTMLSQTLGAIVYLVLAGGFSRTSSLRLEDLDSNGPLIASAILVATPLVLGFLALAVRLSRVPAAEYLALRLPAWEDVGWAVLVLLAVFIVAGLAADWTGQTNPAFVAATFQTARASGFLPLVALSFVILGPLQEELIFRGFLYRGFALSLGPATAIVLTSAIWAIIHMQYDWFFIGEIFALGLAFGWARWKSGSALLTFFLHAIVNATALLGAAFS